VIGLEKKVLGALVSLLLLGACGGGSSGNSAVQAPAALTLTLTSAGVSPKDGSVLSSGSITILNQDSAPHQLTSNPNPSQVDCPELNTPMLAPGDQFTATVANQNEACGFNDGLNPTDSNFQGTLSVIGMGGSPGGGY